MIESQDGIIIQNTNKNTTHTEWAWGIIASLEKSNGFVDLGGCGKEGTVCSRGKIDLFMYWSEAQIKEMGTRQSYQSTTKEYKYTAIVGYCMPYPMGTRGPTCQPGYGADE